MRISSCRIKAFPGSYGLVKRLGGVPMRAINDLKEEVEKSTSTSSYDNRP